MANTVNLKSFQKGQSGNPGGRPRGSRNVSTVLAMMLTEIAPDVVVEASFVKDISKGLKRATVADAMAARLIYEGAVNGNLAALKEVLDRTEGKAKERIQVTHKDDLEAAATIVDVYMTWAKEDNELYGKPMPDKSEIEHYVSIVAEDYDVRKEDLIRRIESASK